MVMEVNNVQLFEVLLYWKHSKKLWVPDQPPHIMGLPDTTAPVAASTLMGYFLIFWHDLVFSDKSTIWADPLWDSHKESAQILPTTVMSEPEIY